MIRTAILSTWHVHTKDYTRQAMENPNIELKVVWDDNVEKGQNFAADWDLPFESNLDTVLAREDIDAVIVDAPTNQHHEVITKAAAAGKHIFTEKVLAITNKEAAAIAEAVAEAGVKFVISFPHRTMRHNLYAKQVIDQGVLGNVSLVRIRNAHNGASAGWLPEHFYDPETCGGGAMIDLGAHGMYLPLWLLGRPETVQSSFTYITGREVEDNAVAVMKFPGGAMAINETGFVSQDSPFSLEVYGDKGCLFVLGPDNNVRLKLGGQDWQTVTDLPPALPSAMEQWVAAIQEGTPVEFDMAAALALTEVMEAAYVSHEKGKTAEL